MPDLLQPLTLSDDDYRTLGGTLTELISDYELEHSQRFREIEVAWKLYDAEPKAKQRTFPWVGASNIVVPYIRTASDAIIARQVATVFDNPTRLWVGRSENEQFAEKYQDNVMRFLNWSYRNEIDAYLPTLDWITENTVLGTSYLFLNWRERQRFVMRPNSRSPMLVTTQRGPVWEHVPQEQLLFQTGVPIADSEIIARQSFLTWTDLIRATADLGWRKSAVEATRPHTADRGSSPGAEARDSRDRREGVTRSLSWRNDYDVRTLFVDWPVLESMGLDRDRITVPGEQGSDRVSVPLIVELCPSSKQVFRVSPYPYLMLPGWPFYELYFRKRSGRPSSPGTAKILDMIQRGLTTIVNQSNDAVTLANAMPFATTDSKWADRRLQPGQGILVDRAEAIVPLGLSKNILPDLQLFSVLQAIGERAIGVGDPQLGREVSMGGHPSPATNTLAQLQQSKELSAPSTKIVRRQLSRLGEATAALYQAYDTDPEGRLRRVFGESDGSTIAEWLFPTDDSIIGNLHLDLFALSETQSPDQQRNIALMRSQVTQNYFGAVLPLIERLPQAAQNPALAGAISQAIEALTKSHKHFLEAADTDEIESFLLQLKQPAQLDAATLQGFSDRVRAAAAPGGGVPPGPLGGGVGVPPQGPGALPFGSVPGANGRGQPNGGGLVP